MTANVPVTVAERAVVAHYAQQGEARVSCHKLKHSDQCIVEPVFEDSTVYRAWTVRVFRVNGRIRVVRSI